MTGSLQTKNGRIYMVIHYKDANGKYKNKWIATHMPVKGNMKAAKAMLEKWLYEHQDCDMNYNNVLFADYLQKWITSVEGDLERSTVRGYREKLKNHIIPYFKNRKIKLIDLKIRDLESFYWDHLSNDKKLSPQTVRHCHRIISKAINDAIRQEMISSNPASLAKCPKVHNHNAKFLNLAQIKQLIELFSGTPIEYIVKLISVYGLRRSEALGLCWDKVDFEKNQFTICRAKIQDKGGDYLKDCTKSYSSCRTLPMTTEIKKMFLYLRQQQEDEKRFVDEGGLGESLQIMCQSIFTNISRKALCPKSAFMNFDIVLHPTCFQMGFRWWRSKHGLAIQNHPPLSIFILTLTRRRREISRISLRKKLKIDELFFRFVLESASFQKISKIVKTA